MKGLWLRWTARQLPRWLATGTRTVPVLQTQGPPWKRTLARCPQPAHSEPHTRPRPSPVSVPPTYLSHQGHVTTRPK